MLRRKVCHMCRMLGRRPAVLIVCLQVAAMSTSSLGDSPFLNAPEAQKAFLDAQTVYDRWKANYGDIERMKFKLSEVKGFLDESGVPEFSVWHHWEKIEDGKKLHVRTSNREIGFADVNTVVVNSFDGTVGKQYLPGLKEGAIYLGRKGAIPEIRNPMRACLDAGTIHLGPIRGDMKEDTRKLLEDLTKRFPDGIPILTYHFVLGLQAGQIKVLPHLERVAGQLCHVIETGNSERGHYCRFWLAHEKGMILLRYVSQSGPRRYSKMEVAKVACAKTDSDHVWYPSLVIREDNSRGKIRRHEIRVHEFVPHIEVPPERFDIEFPAGTWVINELSNVSHSVDGNEDIRRTKPGF